MQLRTAHPTQNTPIVPLNVSTIVNAATWEESAVQIFAMPGHASKPTNSEEVAVTNMATTINVSISHETKSLSSLKTLFQTDNPGGGAGTYCGNEKCNSYEKCDFDKSSKRQKCVRT